MLNADLFTTIPLDQDYLVHLTDFPVPELREHLGFNELWELHPEEYHTLVLHGKEVKTPRWQQAYGRNYDYSGSRNNALPIVPELQHFLDWGQQNVDDRLNGLLLNWYDGAKGHYIGKHRDSRTGLIPDTPIVAERALRIPSFPMEPHWSFPGQPTSPGRTKCPS